SRPATAARTRRWSCRGPSHASFSCPLRSRSSWHSPELRAAAPRSRSPSRESGSRSSIRRTRSSSRCRSPGSSSCASSSRGATCVPARPRSPPSAFRWRSSSYGLRRSSRRRGRTIPTRRRRRVPSRRTLAAFAARRRWSAFVLGGTAVVLGIELWSLVFPRFSDLVSLSQSRRAAGFVPFAFAFAGGAAVLTRALRLGVLPLALAAGIWLQLAYPGDFGRRLAHGGPAFATWFALWGSLAG